MAGNLEPKFVESELQAFLHSQIPNADINCVDEVVLGYIVDMLSDLGEDRENSFDIEQLVELLSAYIPEFERIDTSVVCEWLFDISKSSCDMKSCGEGQLKNNKLTRNSDKEGKVNSKVDATACLSKGDLYNKFQYTARNETDTSVKECLMQRYAYVEEGHHPVMPKEKPTSMIRYRENMVVNNKGERYTIETNKDREGYEMKKTYINLKPLRKYRFH